MVQLLCLCQSCGSALGRIQTIRFKALIRSTNFSLCPIYHPHPLPKLPILQQSADPDVISEAQQVCLRLKPNLFNQNIPEDPVGPTIS